MLFFSYVVGLWFTLRTHAAVIWNTEVDEKKPLPTSGPNGSTSDLPNVPQLTGYKHQSISATGSVSRNPMRDTSIRDTQLYKRILGQSLKQVGLGPSSPEDSRHTSAVSNIHLAQSQQSTPYIVPPKSGEGEGTVNDNASVKTLQLEFLSEEQNNNLVRQVAEMAATAATVAARDATRAPRRTQTASQALAHHPHRGAPSRAGTVHDEHDDVVGAEAATHAEGGGHDAPNWSRLKSAVILLGATLLYAIIAEILVNTVDVVLESVDIDEKFLGITLFALVPNTTEFLVSQKIYASMLGTNVSPRTPSLSL